MGWKTVHLTRPCKIKVKDKNLSIKFYDTQEEVKVTIKDIDFILFDNTQFSITGKSLAFISKNNIATLFIDDEFHPSAVLTPYHQHSTMREIANCQISTPQNFKEIIWKNIIVSKVQNQASVLRFLNNPLHVELLDLANKVQLYDKNQDEAQAARVYWKNLFDKSFRRDKGKEDIVNLMLNYVYSILRACVARSVSASGMLPVFGIWHKNKYNAFALVDDLMEPFRPICDVYVKKLIDLKYNNASYLYVDIKRDLVAILSMECVKINGGISNLSSAVELFVREYKKSMMSGEVDRIFFPTIDFEYFRDEFI